MEFIKRSEGFAKAYGRVGVVLGRSENYVDLELPNGDSFSAMKGDLEKATEEEIGEWRVESFIERLSFEWAHPDKDLGFS